MDPGYAPTKKGKIGAKSVCADMKRLGEIARSALPRISAGGHWTRLPLSKSNHLW